MTLRMVKLLAFLPLLTAASAEAARLRGTFQTLISGRQDPRRGDVVSVVPAYELISLRLSEISLPGADSAQLVMQGWGRIQLGADALDDDGAELSLLYLESQHGALRLRLGRQAVAGGVGRLDYIDGLHAHIPVGWGGLSLQAYGGANVHRAFRYRSGGYTAGGRLAKHFGSIAQVGVGYKRTTRRAETVREDLAADASAWIGRQIRLLAIAMWSTDELAFVEGRLAATYRAAKNLNLTVDAERTVPDLMLPRDSIFTVFSNLNRDAVGLNADWSPSPYYSADAALSTLWVDGNPKGYRATVGLRTYREPTHESVVGIEAQRLADDERGYVRGRAFTSLQLREPLRVSADVHAYRFDETINGVSESLLAHLSVVYDLAPSMRVATTVSGGSTPYAERQLEGMLRFAYGHAMDFAREMGP